MNTYTLTFQDIDHPERTTVTTIEALDERFALKAATDQLRESSAEQAWTLLSIEADPANTPAPTEFEEDFAA